MKNIIEIKTTLAGKKISLEIEYATTTVKHGYNEIEQVGSLKTNRKATLVIGDDKFCDHGFSGLLPKGNKAPAGTTHFVGGSSFESLRVALTTEQYDAMQAKIEMSDAAWTQTEEGQAIAAYEAKIESQVADANQATVETNQIENRIAYGEK